MWPEFHERDDLPSFIVVCALIFIFRFSGILQLSTRQQVMKCGIVDLHGRRVIVIGADSQGFHDILKTKNAVHRARNSIFGARCLPLRIFFITEKATTTLRNERQVNKSEQRNDVIARFVVRFVSTIGEVEQVLGKRKNDGSEQ